MAKAKRPPTWRELLRDAAYLASKEFWSVQEVALIALLEALAPPDVLEWFAAIRARALSPRRSDRLDAPPSQEDQDDAADYTLGGPVWRVRDPVTGKMRRFRVSAETVQIFRDSEKPANLQYPLKNKAGGRKRRKPKPKSWSGPRWPWEER